jgi:hypothetical protein
VGSDEYFENVFRKLPSAFVVVQKTFAGLLVDVVYSLVLIDVSIVVPAPDVLAIATCRWGEAMA